jgi:hypothetical protein
MIPPHHGRGANFDSQTGILRPSASLNVQVRCFTGPDFRDLTPDGGWSTNVQIPGRFQARIVLAYRYCH